MKSPVQELQKEELRKCFIVFSSQSYHLGLFMLAVQPVRSQGMCFEEVGPHCTQPGAAGVERILEALHLERALIFNIYYKPPIHS